MVKNPPAMWETWVRSLGWKISRVGHGNLLQYSCLENPHRQRSLAGCGPWGHKELDTFTSPHFTSWRGEGHGDENLSQGQVT